MLKSGVAMKALEKLCAEKDGVFGSCVKAGIVCGKVYCPSLPNKMTEDTMLRILTYKLYPS